MRLIVENPETSEKREIEVVGLEQEQFQNLQTLHYPSETNPEQSVKRKLENLDFPADKKAQLWEKISVYGQATMRLGTQVISIGRRIFDSILYIIRSYPKTSAGLAVGAVLAALVGLIPIIGWLLGPLAAVIFPLIGGIQGYKEDIADKNFKRRIDEAMKKTIDEELQIYKPLK